MNCPECGKECRKGRIEAKEIGSITQFFTSVIWYPEDEKDKWIRIGVLALAIIFALIVAYVFLLNRGDKPKLQRPKPMMQTPISPRFNKDTTKKDTNQSKQHESAGNQQQFNAQGRDDSTGHLQNR